MSSVDALLNALGAAEPLSVTELRTKLSVSQPTISRLVKRAGPRVARLGKGRATRYAATRPVFGAEWRVQIFAVNHLGVVSEVASLQSLTSGQYLVTDATGCDWLQGLNRTGLFAGLPYFLYDLRPAGFLGRKIARKLATEWDVPADPRRWADDQIGEYLLRRGIDLPGNLVVGRAAARQVQQIAHVTVGDREIDYPALAERTLADDVLGSSAAGEQPKFAVFHPEVGHVIVKFSPAADTADANRWKDLLHAEHHALTHLRRQGFAAAETALFRFKGRIFLESRRFDRSGEKGRIPSLSLSMIDAEYAGVGRQWHQVAHELHTAKLIDRQTLEQITWLHVFGEWIANSDMHLGNLSLRPTNNGFTLHPVYDMLPAALAPVRGDLLQLNVSPPIQTRANEAVWKSAGLTAVAYWQTVMSDPSLSTHFRDIAQQIAGRWSSLLA